VNDPDETLDPSSEFERRLLEAARAERPSSELSARMAQALGVPAPSAVAPPLEAAKGIFSSWVGFSALAVVAASALVWALWPRQAAAPVERRTIVTEPSGAPAPADESAPARESAREVQIIAPVPSASPLSPAPSNRTSAIISKPGASGSALRGDLREEIRLIDAARAAVTAHAPDQALALLQRYTATYPAGVFGQEASVLRIEALNQSGQHARAKALARDFLARHANSPLAERAERVLK
jgi:hypothetical protein